VECKTAQITRWAMTLIRQMLEIELIWIGQLGLDISYMEGMYMKPVWSAKLLRSYDTNLTNMKN
jgi:hypothetical protein